jgi:RNA polymerase-binding transcription factor
VTTNAADPAPGWKSLGIHEARQRLQHERNSRLAQLTAIEADQPQANEELIAAQTTAIRRVLTEIDAAEARLDAGTYGRCALCKSSIPIERLEILPYVAHCVSCQERAL